MSVEFRAEIPLHRPQNVSPANGRNKICTQIALQMLKAKYIQVWWFHAYRQGVFLMSPPYRRRGKRWRSWLRHCAANRKIAGSIPDGIIEIFY